MNVAALALARGRDARALGLERALADARRLLSFNDTHDIVLAKLGQIELPDAAQAAPGQLRELASLYLASALESAGLIEAADDLTRLLRSGAMAGDLGDAATLLASFYADRNNRPSLEERQALFSRLFGATSGASDLQAAANGEFDERLFDLCDAITASGAQRGEGRLHAAARRLAENLAAAGNDFLAVMAREITNSLQRAAEILNHPQIRALFGARSLWDVVAAIDRRFRRPFRATLNHLRRGRAGMSVIAWLADVTEDPSGQEKPWLVASEAVIASAVDWVDETLAILHAQEAAGAVGGESEPQIPEGRRRAGLKLPDLRG